ncbi:hypothetical protein PAUR_a3258 [Pseudoalteromonas aurantia 208]|uniref:Uncharacterized protein n=1 Tax=Pseudoalteromonas aurantia 208 TaxID=1314867 RepID=A0ABR9E5L4_9GAMM|nr:hypothetical protein [Pseudoalteromonas aurantia 208]
MIKTIHNIKLFIKSLNNGKKLIDELNNSNLYGGSIKAVDIKTFL